MVVEVGHSGVQVQEFLSAFSSSEPLLTSLLSPCGSMFLFNDVVAARCRDHLLVVDASQARDLPDRGSITPQLIGMDDLWDVILTQEASHERFRRLRVTVPLKEDVKHESVLVHRSPEPVSDAVHARTHLVEMPPGTPPGFPVAQFLCEEGSEFQAPLAESLVAHLNAAPVQQFLHVSVAQRKAMVEPNGVLDDEHRETVAVRLGVGHGQSAYPDPIKATQPIEVLVAEVGTDQPLVLERRETPFWVLPDDADIG